ncbi:MAG: hypothetical protein HY898_16405 [Deltaproteobacteria bacterium]|nr:hypothetical protein [Deltaproteobacteria bacterium]
MTFAKIPAALREGWPKRATALAASWKQLLGPHVPEDLSRMREPPEGAPWQARPIRIL